MSRKPRSQRVTLARVAQESNVSVTTASLILSGRPEAVAQFQPETIERVRRSADVLGYRANLFAASLLAERSSFFALVMRGEHTAPEHWRSNAYESEFLSGVTETIPDDVYPVVAVAGPGTNDAKVHAIERIMGGGVFGTIFRTPRSILEKCIRDRMGRGHPVVVAFPSRLQDWPQNAVDVDNTAVGQVAGDLLARRGARRWLIVRDEESAAQSLREEGCRGRADESGAICSMVTIPASLKPGEPDPAAIDCMREFKPDAVFSMTLRTSVAMLDACRAIHARPGKDLAMVGCDCAFWFHPLDPQITSVDVSWFEAGAAAVRSLLQMVEKGEDRCSTVLLPPRVIAGQTCPLPEDGPKTH